MIEYPRDDSWIGPERWAWLEDESWRWLTNILRVELAPYLARVAAKYGLDNMRVDNTAHDANRHVIPEHVAIFVRRERFEEALHSGQGVFPEKEA